MFNRRRNREEYVHQVLDALAAHGVDWDTLPDRHQDRLGALVALDTDPDVIAHHALALLKNDRVNYPTRLLVEHWTPANGTLPADAAFDLPLCLN